MFVHYQSLFFVHGAAAYSSPWPALGTWKRGILHLQEDAFQPFDFTALLEYGLEGHYEAVAAISLRASKEAGLERALAAMRADWDGVAFAVVPYKDTGTFVIGGVDEIQALLDDQAVRVAAIRSSPFVGFVAGKAAKWAEFVETLQVWTHFARDLAVGQNMFQVAPFTLLALLQVIGCKTDVPGPNLSMVGHRLRDWADMAQFGYFLFHQSLCSCCSVAHF